MRHLSKQMAGFALSQDYGINNLKCERSKSEERLNRLTMEDGSMT